MNILITESQYDLLFRPQVELYLIEGEEAQKYLDLLKEDENLDKPDSFNYQKLQQSNLDDDCTKIEGSSLPKDSKDKAVLKLVGDEDLPQKLQNWTESNIHNANINGLNVLTLGKRRFIFNITTHWAARVYRKCSKPIEPKYKGIKLVKDNIEKIKEFITNKGMAEMEEKSVIVLKMTDGNLYNEVVAIRKENNPKLNNLFKLTFITQMENEYLYNKYRLPRLAL